MQIEAKTWDQWADALRGAPAGVKEAIAGLINVELKDSNDFATHPDTPEEKRPGWCGRARGMSDLSDRINELESGAYRSWPEYKARNLTEGNEENEDADDKEPRKDRKKGKIIS